MVLKIGCAVILFLVIGCRAVEPKKSAPFFCQTGGLSVQKRPIEVCYYGNGQPAILIFAGIHGDEQASCTLAEVLKEKLVAEPKWSQGKQIILITRLNPDGIIANSRFNSNGIDLNRNFPTDNRINNEVFGIEPLCQPESKFLYDLVLQSKPDRILSIHQPLACIDFDGPAEELAKQMGRFCPLPIQKLGARPGSFGSFAGDTLDIPTITLEMERNDDLLTSHQLWAKYSNCILSFISYPENPF